MRLGAQSTNNPQEVEPNNVQFITLTLVERRSVTFTPDTINNEHHNCKKSKVCCIKKENKALKDRNKYDRF